MGKEEGDYTGFEAKNVRNRKSILNRWYMLGGAATIWNEVRERSIKSHAARYLEQTIKDYWLSYS